MGKHSIFAPSSSNRWFNCPGSIELGARARAERPAGSESSPAAEEGTRAHDEASTALESSIYELTGLDPAVVYYLQHIASEKRRTPPLAEFYEFPVRSLAYPEIYGTLDYALLSRDRLVVMDYKHGSGVLVQPNSNQLKIYAYMFLESIKPIAPAQLELHIVQPRYNGEDPVRKLVLDTQDFIESFGKELNEAMRAVKYFPEYTALGSWCQFCPATSLCPSQTEKFNELFNAADADVDHLSRTELVDVLDKSQSVKKLIKESEAKAKRLLSDGKMLDGWELQVYNNGRKRLRKTKTMEELNDMFDKEESK
jgi:hypothetical protein